MKTKILIILSALLILGLSADAQQKPKSKNQKKLTKSQQIQQMSKAIDLLNEQLLESKKSDTLLLKTISKQNALISDQNALIEKMQYEIADLKQKEVADQKVITTTPVVSAPITTKNTVNKDVLIVDVTKKDSATIKKVVSKPGVMPVVEKDTMSSGRFTKVLVADINHYVTVEETSNIIDTILKGNVDVTKMYTLSDGFRIKILHPVDWLRLMMEAYVSIDSTITDTKKFLEAVNNSETATWDDKMLPTRNYYWSQYGSITFIPDYNGTAYSARVITYKGYPVMKMNCMNPQLPTPVSTVVKK